MKERPIRPVSASKDGLFQSTLDRNIHTDLNPLAAGIAETPEASKHTIPQTICAVRRSFWIELNAIGSSLPEQAIDAARIRASKNEPEQTARSPPLVQSITPE